MRHAIILGLSLALAAGPVAAQDSEVVPGLRAGLSFGGGTPAEYKVNGLRVAGGEPAAKGSGLGWGLLAIAAGIGLTAVVLDEAEEAFGAAAGEAAEDTALTVLGGGQASDETVPPPCDGVEVGDNCVGG